MSALGGKRTLGSDPQDGWNCLSHAAIKCTVGPADRGLPDGKRVPQLCSRRPARRRSCRQSANSSRAGSLVGSFPRRRRRILHRIERSLAQCGAVLVLWSRNSIASPWVRYEAAAGRDHGKLVPVSLDGCEPPIGFRQYHTISLEAWRWARRATLPVHVVQSITSKLNSKAAGRDTVDQQRGLQGSGRRGIAAGVRSSEGVVGRRRV